MRILKTRIISITYPVAFALTLLITPLYASDCDDRQKKTGVSTLTGNHGRALIDKIHPLVWANSNPDSIMRDQRIALAVSGGKPPYTWTVQGTSFTLASQSTTDGNNQLSAGNSACGAATITVTEKGGQSITKYVKCTTGKWVQISTDTSCTVGAGISILCEEIVGNRKIRVMGRNYYYLWGSCKCNGPHYCINITCIQEGGWANYYPGCGGVLRWEWRCF
jgi:hypothetical protein